VDVLEGSGDWSRKMPWRAPGQSPVLGSGCGVAGGNSVPVPNGGMSLNYPLGMDGADLPAMEPTEWHIGQAVEVAFTMLANHGGGYSYRLCKKTENITEDCFQKTVLKFHGNNSCLHWAEILPNRNFDGFLHIPRIALPRVLAPLDQVYPKGSHWARNPVPACKYCDQSICGGLLPNMTELVTAPDAHPKPAYGGDAWWKQEKCAQECSGFNLMQCPPGMAQFPEPLPSISGYIGRFVEGFSYSIVDEVEVPEDLEEGDYLLSWRWDCEQSPQIWQQCSDVKLVHPDTVQV